MDPGPSKDSLGSLGELLSAAWVLRWAPWEVLGGALGAPGTPLGGLEGQEGRESDGKGWEKRGKQGKSLKSKKNIVRVGKN